MTSKSLPLEWTERDLSRWRLVEDFQARLVGAAQAKGLAATWTHPQRLMAETDYLSLFLPGLLNPVVRTMRGLCAASHLERVQKEVCRRPVSLGSFSEAQSLLDPGLLKEVFGALSREVGAMAPSPGGARNWKIQDGSLFEALPRMHWCFWRRQGRVQSQVRLHLSLELGGGHPVRADVTAGKGCERAAWRQQCQRGDAYIGDRYYGQNYQLLGELDARGVALVVRLRQEAVFDLLEELPLTPGDRENRVIRHARVQLGGKGYRLPLPLRLVWVQTDKEVLVLVTNLTVEELSAADVALLYRERWQVELFFRWIKCILGCRHWLAESEAGVTIQIYLALIAALLLQLYTGARPSRRMMEMIQFYLLGVASLEELWAAAERERERAAKKS